jgi:hypothetical protein
MGPMHPVSRPKRSPPIEMRMQQRMYGAGRRMVVVFIMSWLSRARDGCVVWSNSFRIAGCSIIEEGVESERKLTTESKRRGGDQKLRRSCDQNVSRSQLNTEAWMRVGWGLKPDGKKRRRRNLSLTHSFLSCPYRFSSEHLVVGLPSYSFITVESPMGIEDLDNNFWWAEPLNRVNAIVEEGLPSGHVQNR